MAEIKTKKNQAKVEAFLEAVEHPTRKRDSFTVLELMRELTGDQGSMWGSSIVGFGEYTYSYADGSENNWMRIGFSPRKQNLTLYIMDGNENYDEILSRLGKHKTGKSCLYINKLEDVDMDVLKELIEASLEAMEETYGK